MAFKKRIYCSTLVWLVNDLQVTNLEVLRFRWAIFLVFCPLLTTLYIYLVECSISAKIEYQFAIIRTRYYRAIYRTFFAKCSRNKAVAMTIFVIKIEFGTTRILLQIIFALIAIRDVVLAL